MHTCADVIHSVPFFDDAEEGFIASLVTMLRPQVRFAASLISLHTALQAYKVQKCSAAPTENVC